METMTVLPLRNTVDAAAYAQNCVDIPKFSECCAACSNYGTVWSCPPFDFSVEDFWRQYRTLELVGRKILVPETLQAQRFDKAALAAQYAAVLRPVKTALLKELFAMEAAEPGSRVLSAGGCERCQTCARVEGKPCRQPEWLRPSIESLGGDVGRTIADYLGEKLVWAGADRLPPYFILLGGLLRK